LSPQVADEDVFMAPRIIPSQKYDGTRAPKSPPIKAPQTPPIPPWRKEGLASVASSSRAASNQVQPKKMPATASAERAASSQASTSAVKPAASSQAATSSVAPAAPETAATVDEALLAYRAAEAAVNKCAKESLFGPYNEAYYRVETKVAIEKAISWRDRGPREANEAD
jgi:cell pole-organizing protein PopZ